MVTQGEAIEIAKQHCGGEFELFSIGHGVPEYRGIYKFHMWASDDVWCIICSSHPENIGILASSRFIVIHKDTGKVLYDGSTNDEG